MCVYEIYVAVRDEKREEKGKGRAPRHQVRKCTGVPLGSGLQWCAVGGFSSQFLFFPTGFLRNFVCYLYDLHDTLCTINSMAKIVSSQLSAKGSRGTPVEVSRVVS